MSSRIGGAMPVGHLAVGRSYAIACYACAGVLIVTWLTADSASFDRNNADWLTASLFRHQDKWVALIALFACLLRPVPRTQGWAPPEKQFVWLCLVGAFLICWVGHDLIFLGFDLSRDEQMVKFDAAILQNGALVGTIPAEWRAFGDAFHWTFVLKSAGGTEWVSSYLPVNAAFHAIGQSLGDIDITAPLLVSAGGYFLWLITRRLWPDSATTRLVAIVLYLASSQVMITGMTKFAMSAHLTLNLLWLLLFLRNDRWSHLGAMAVGFFAVGIHQPFFHPIFVAPFMLLVLVRREWKLLAAYLAAYALIMAFWLYWPALITSSEAGAAVSTTAEVSFTARILAALKPFDLHGTWLMAANILRFMIWQHPLLVPLAILGAIAAWRANSFARVLVTGIALQIILFWIVLPWQGYGWGYRYLHPVLGNFILLAASGWHALEGDNRRSLARPFMLTTLIAVFALLPLHAIMARHIVRPFSTADQWIAGLPATAVIIDGRIRDDLAYNSPDVSNRPVRLLSGGIAPEQMSELCARGPVIFVDPAASEKASAHGSALKQAASRAHCSVRTLPAAMLADPDAKQQE